MRGIHTTGYRSNNNFIHGVNEFVVKRSKKGDDDHKRNNSAKHSSVFWLSFVAKEFRRVKEITFQKKILEVFE
jgi:hypothetical protein